MTSPPRIAALIVAAGSGSRAGGTLPKQFAPVAGRPMLAHAVAAMSAHPAIAEVLVVVAEGQQATAAAVLSAMKARDVRIVVGGASRRESVANGIAALPDATQVLVHDAARPFLPTSVVNSIIGALTTSDAAIPVLAVADTLARGLAGDGGLHLGATVPRDALRDRRDQ